MASSGGREKGLRAPREVAAGSIGQAESFSGLAAEVGGKAAGGRNKLSPLWFSVRPDTSQQWQFLCSYALDSLRAYIAVHTRKNLPICSNTN